MISQEQISALKAKLESTKAKLQAQDFSGLTKDDILGDLLCTAALLYFVELDTLHSVQSSLRKIVSSRLPSEALFSLELGLSYIFGLPRSVSAGGLAMDVDRNVHASKSTDGNRGTTLWFHLADGLIGSALENLVPEQLFSTPDMPIQGISAAKALQIADEQAIPIFAVNSANINTVLPQLQIDADVKVDIQNAVQAGKIVIVPQTRVAVAGWTGSGYVVIDPATGASAYMISGGLSGGWAEVGELLGRTLIIAACVVAITVIVASVIANPSMISVIADFAIIIGRALAQIYVKFHIKLDEYMFLTSAIEACISFYGMGGSAPIPTTPFELLIFSYIFRVTFFGKLLKYFAFLQTLLDDYNLIVLSRIKRQVVI